MRTKLFLSVFFFGGILFSQPSQQMMTTNLAVTAVAVDGDYTYIGGGFNYVGYAVGGGVKLKIDSVTANFSFPLVNGVINSIVADGEGGWIIGGNFLKVGSYNRNNLAKLDSNGSVDENWIPDPDGAITSIVIGGNDLYIGGGFNNIDNTYSPNFALFTDRVLPVELSTFTAQYAEGKVLLSWQTATETNNAGFVIERKDGSEWEKLDFLLGSGTSSAPHQYRYTDEKPTAGTSLYRLKQIDKSGSFHYSSEVSVTTSQPLVFSLEQNYPNPFNPSTTIGFTLEK